MTARRSFNSSPWRVVPWQTTAGKTVGFQVVLGKAPDLVCAETFGITRGGLGAMTEVEARQAAEEEVARRNF
jgi:hypothetical protein